MFRNSTKSSSNFKLFGNLLWVIGSK